MRTHQGLAWKDLGKSHLFQGPLNSQECNAIFNPKTLSLLFIWRGSSSFLEDLYTLSWNVWDTFIGIPERHISRTQNDNKNCFQKLCFEMQ